MLLYTYVIYLVVSVAMTIWVAWTLSTRGRIFLVDGFGGKEELADSINHLLVVGFYLINLGWVLLSLRYGARPSDWPQAIEFLTTKLGFIMLIVGGMHFFNMFVISQLRQRALNFRRMADAPVQPPQPLPPPLQPQPIA